MRLTIGVIVLVGLVGALALTSGSAQYKTSPADVENWQKSYAALLSRYVTPSGVRYAAWRDNAGDLAALDQVTDQLARATPPEGAQAKLAFYLDAYNAIVLHRVLKVYPIPGVLEHDEDFFKRSITLAGHKISLDHLENEIIRKQFKEPRIHFLLNCASVSCPPLLPKPCSGCDLDQVLEAQTKAYLTSKEGCRDDGCVSQIFEWFAGDFEAAEGNVLNFINKHRATPLKTSQLTFQPYNWNLNQAP